MIIKYSNLDKKINYLEQIENGKVLIFKNLFFKLNLYDFLLEKLFNIINKKKKIDSLNNIHNFFKPDEVIKCHNEITEKLNFELLKITEIIFKTILNNNNFWINQNSVIRMMQPYEYIINNNKLSQFKGKLDLHDPHIDSHQSVAHNAINYWIPLNNVDENNSMAFYPDIFNKKIFTKNGKIHKKTFLGNPEILKCDKGDIVVFKGELAHCSILNTSNITRFVITNRITIKKPIHPRNFIPLKYYSAKNIATLKKNELYKTYKKDFYRFRNILIINEIYISKIILKFFPKLIQSFFNNFIKYIFDKLLNYRMLNEKNDIQLIKKNKFNNLEYNEKECFINLDNKSFSFQRYCPHKGADLSNAIIKNGYLICPWHQYCFNLNNHGKGKKGIYNLKFKTLKR